MDKGGRRERVATERLKTFCERSGPERRRSPDDRNRSFVGEALRAAEGHGRAAAIAVIRCSVGQGRRVDEAGLHVTRWAFIGKYRARYYRLGSSTWTEVRFP